MTANPCPSLHRAIWLLLLLALLPLLGACGATRIEPPQAVQQPARVYVLDHGRHTSLVLSAPDGSLHRYAYGDWRYYAERDTGVWSSIAALLWSTPGGLGRMQMPGPPTAANVHAQVRVGIEQLHSLEVERDKVEQLRARLDTLYAQTDTRLAVPAVDLIFAPYPRGYSLAYNSNQVVADWLTELDCRVSRRPLLADWRVIPAE